MVLAHVSDAWTAEPYRGGEAWYLVSFVGGIASPLFLFLAGVAIAMAASVKGAVAARRRGWQVFGLALLFRVQSQILGMGPLDNLFKVDMLNIMGLSMVAATYVWELGGDRRTRIAAFAALTTGLAMTTPIVRDVTWLAPLPDPLEAYLRPEGHYAAFPFFPWGGFLFAGVIVGDLIQGVRLAQVRDVLLQNSLAVGAGAGVMLAWWASFQPSIYESSSFWHDSPTFFFIRLGLLTLLVPIAWVLERLLAARVFMPLATLGHSSLFVYWIHVEMVYGVIADPVKRTMPLWMAMSSTVMLCVALYSLVLLKSKARSAKLRLDRPLTLHPKR